MSVIIINDFNLDIDFYELFDQVLRVSKKKLKKNEDYNLSVSLIDDHTIQKLNKEYRNIDKKTDVISFAMLDSEDIVKVEESSLDLGDIFISVETAQEQADNLNQSLKREILFLFIHGLLHLLGFDHQSKEEEQTMFKLQREILHEVLEKSPF